MTKNNQGVFDRDNPERRQAERERERQRAEEEIADVDWLMHQPEGRRFIYRLLEQAGVYRSTFSDNALQTAFAEGERNLGLRYLAMVQEHCLERFILMLEEKTKNGE